MSLTPTDQVAIGSAFELRRGSWLREPIALGRSFHISLTWQPRRSGRHESVGGWPAVSDSVSRVSSSTPNSLSRSTLVDIFLQNISGPVQDRTYIRFKPERTKPYQSLTFRAFGERVFRFAAGLRSLGIERGDRIALISESRPEWLIADFASLMIGAITVPMFPTLTAKQVEFILADSGARAAIVSNDLQLGKAGKSLEQAPELKHLIVMNDEVTMAGDRARGMLIHFRDVEQRAPALDASMLAGCATPEETVTIIYTSGTTGTPKGVMLTHNNLVSNVEGALAAIPSVTMSDTFLSFLPLSHSFERIASYLVFSCGATIAFAHSIDTVPENMLEIHPTVMTGVPRFYERIHTRINKMRDTLPESRKKLFNWAMNIGSQVGMGFEGKPVPTMARLLHPLADRLVLKKIRARTGGKIRFFVSGAAALSPEVGRAFAAFGLPIIEGYGMTEASPVIAVSPIKKIKWGKVGPALSNIEVMVAEDGELLTRGPHVMKGYYRQPEATAETIDRDGWLHTGDIGELDNEGYISITDRKKHLLVSSGGKNIAPAHVESLLMESPFIDQVMLIGDRRQYCTALVVPDFDALNEYLNEHGIPFTPTSSQLIEDTAIRSLIRDEIETRLADVASYERVRRFAILREPFTIENSMLTPTLKVKRKEVEFRYHALIDSLYASER